MFTTAGVQTLLERLDASARAMLIGRHRKKTTMWVEAEAIFSGVPRFPFRLTRVDRFPEVVYLTSEPVDRFSRLTAAIATRWHETPPYRGIYPQVIPHLTVARTSDGPAEKEIRRGIEPFLPIACIAREVVLLVAERGVWSIRHRFPLGPRLSTDRQVKAVGQMADRKGHGQLAR